MSELVRPETFTFPSPSELKRFEIRTKRRVSSELAGEFRSAFRGSGLLFSDLREYVPGDDVKHIHWRATAKTSKTYVKNFIEDRSLRIHIALDVSRSLYSGTGRSKLQQALEFSGLIAALSVGNRDSVSLSLFADKTIEFIRSGSSRHHLQQVLRTLLTPRALPKATNLADHLTYLQKILKRATVVFIVSDFVAPDFFIELQKFSKRHDLNLIGLSPFEGIPEVGIVEFADAESDETVEIDSSNPQVRSLLSQAHNKWIAQQRSQALKAGGTFTPLKNSPLATLAELNRTRTHARR